MSKISNLIFKNANHYITSKYGKRASISTSEGNTGTFHRGTDYGTNSKKLPQYAIEDGVILSCGKATDKALYVWVKYPRLNVKMLHYHLDSISVKNGQKVVKGTKLGVTGKTGKATGIHLHLGVYDLKKNAYVDPEVYSLTYKEPAPKFFPTKGYFKLGDTHKNVGKIASFMYKTFPAYTKKAALGNYYGKNIKASITEFQKRTGLKADGMVGSITLAKLKEFGFKE